MSSCASPAKLRVVLVTEAPIPPISRGNLRLYRLGLSLARRGHEVYMITPSELPHKKNSVVHEGIFMYQFRGFGKFLYSRLRLPVRLYHLFGTLLTILSMHLRKGVNVIHAWNPIAGLAAVIGGRLIRRPIFIDFTDFYSDIARTDSLLLVPVFKAIEWFILRAATKVIVVSEEMAHALTKLGVSGNRIFIVPDGTDCKMFNLNLDGRDIRVKHNLNQAPVIIYHGDIKPPDGVDLLYRAFALILKRVPAAKLLIVGGGGRYFDKLKNLAEELGIEKSIICTYWVPHSEVPKYIAAADVGAMPMRATLNHNCYLSFKLFEYWGAGKPVVTSNLKAISRIVKNGVNGLVVESEDVEALADAFIELLENPEKAQKMGREGRQLVEANFDWDVLMRKEVELYKDMCY